MRIDPEQDERRRAIDALDKLRMVHARLAERETSSEPLFDFVLRMMAVVAIAWLVYWAFTRL